MRKRLEAVDVVGIVVRKAVPIITQHLHELTIAELKVMDTVKTVGLDSLEHSSISDAVAANSKGHVLHLAAQTSDLSEDGLLENEDKVQQYLRGVVSRLLPIVLPNNEYASSIVTTFVREVLACAILAPLFRMLADPDYWNETLVVRANQAIQERARVKRFRHALKEQTRDQSKRNKSIKKKPMRRLERLMLSNDHKDWERLYRKIKKCQSLADVTRMRSEMILLRNEKIAAVQVDRTVKNTSMSDHLVIKALSLLEVRITKLGGPHTTGTSSTIVRSLSFDRVLVIGVDYFLDYLERHGRANLLDFWHHVTQIKLKSNQPVPASQLSILDSSVHLSKIQIKHIYEQYFDSPLLTITDDEKSLSKELDDYPTFRNDKAYYSMMSALGMEAPSSQPLVRSSSTASIIRHNKLGMSKFRNMSSTDLVDLGSEYLGHETMGMIDTNDKDVLAAMEDALHSSLMASASEELSKTSSRSASVHDTDDDGSDSSISGNEMFTMNGQAIRRLDVPSNLDSSITELKTAEPGNLNILEEIETLDHEIQKRQHSLTYIDKFLKNKHDIDDLDRKIVNKSRVQTTRELDSLLSQKRQYEADDHSLYGRSTVVIDSSMTHQDADGNDFVVYVVEVRRVGADGTPSGWIITRRYSEFNQLQAQLKIQFPHVANLDFPKKQLNRLKSVADARRPILESFLQNLLKDEQVCKSLELRNFLSQNNLTVKKRHHKTVLENLIGLTDPREAFSRLFTMLEGPDETGRPENPDLRQVHPAPPPTDHDEDLSSFAKPIVDLVLEAFDLRERSKWIKKKAVVLVLQQILGGTIESRVRDGVTALVEEKSLVALLGTLYARLAAVSGQDGESVVPRAGKTRAERQRLLELAKETMRAYHPPYVPESAAKKVFRALQIRTLNMHLLGRLIDGIVEAVFFA
ncbi:putative Intermediate filament protein [Taphrina deformans PYCC 5710]|uniref:Intermediate filament protein n=1 Tax=Taphrina deformans (strain PYCC 5710 / ATCC 11124 / CBS 356.35 / IMI 108563 / JCM 9778 / NBRC 8474) TaxID=1097556 RepID=S0BE53_TAPDE|nr:putative Intermediate filament protein [Taphrina deformans PYCC 5710]|eukprot:CCG81551.1 putative Intermediate filament protein [Taphrina deformans PYCC 5710]